MRVVLAGGGSGGHVSPLLALADALRRRDPGGQITCLGTEEGMEARLVPAAGLALATIPRVPLPRELSPRLLAVPGRLAGAVRAAGAVIDTFRPDVVVGFGGYVAVPAYLAARRRRVPIVVHEQNAKPGIANRFAATLLTRNVGVTMPGTSLPHAVEVGLPIRRQISGLDRPAMREKGRAQFGLRTDLPTLLVTGGSQGARRLNQAVSGAAAALAAAGVQVLHVTGPLQTISVPPEPAAPPYVVVPYTDRMDLAFAAADLVCCRAGANTVVEVAAVGLPAVFVPYPVGNGEQRLNAAHVVGAGGGLLVEDADFTADWVRANVVPLVVDADRLAAMSTAAQHLVRRDGDERLADLVVAAAERPAR